MKAIDALEEMFRLIPADEAENAALYLHIVEKDLDILEILKKHLRVRKQGEFEEINTFTKCKEPMQSEIGEMGDWAFCNFTGTKTNVSEEDIKDFDKVSEWIKSIE